VEHRSRGPFGSLAAAVVYSASPTSQAQRIGNANAILSQHGRECPPGLPGIRTGTPRWWRARSGPARACRDGQHQERGGRALAGCWALKRPPQGVEEGKCQDDEILHGFLGVVHPTDLETAHRLPRLQELRRLEPPSPAEAAGLEQLHHTVRPLLLGEPHTGPLAPPSPQVEAPAAVATLAPKARAPKSPKTTAATTPRRTLWIKVRPGVCKRVGLLVAMASNHAFSKLAKMVRC
jgi:hypothetical protein